MCLLIKVFHLISASHKVSSPTQNPVSATGGNCFVAIFFKSRRDFLTVRQRPPSNPSNNPNLVPDSTRPGSIRLSRLAIIFWADSDDISTCGHLPAQDASYKHGQRTPFYIK